MTTELPYPYQALPQVRENWADGKHPKDCTGKCDVTGAGCITVCHGCGWDDYSAIIEFLENKT